MRFIEIKPINPDFPPPKEDSSRLRQRIISVVNQKGGVGKTTTAINLATALAATNHKVLLLDFDPQGNASTGLGIAQEERAVSSYEIVIGSKTIDQACKNTDIPGLSLIPSSIELSGAELELVGVERREYRLKESFNKSHEPFDYVFIDCPPSLGLLTLNAMVASDALLVPLQCEFFALEGLSQLLKTIDRVKANFNPSLTVQGVVLTMFDRRNNLSGQVEADVRSHLGDQVYTTVIPRNIRISEAPSYGKPALIYDHDCLGSRAYIDLARELLQRERSFFAT